MAITIKDPDTCTGCGGCAEECPMDVLVVEDTVQIVNADDCLSCGLCSDVCPFDVLAVE